MADDYVQAPADGAGKMLQTKKNLVGANNVHAECMYLVKADGTDDPVHQVLVTDLLRGLTDPATTKVVNEVDFTWNADGTMATAVFKDVAVATLLTLTMTYTSGNLTKVLRS
jgi:hypothetical protein